MPETFYDSARLSQSIISVTDDVCPTVRTIPAYELWGDDFDRFSVWDYENNGCSNNYAIEQCVERAESLCTMAFNSTGQKHTDESPISQTMTVILVACLMFASIIYSIYQEIAHTKRAELIQKNRQSESLNQLSLTTSSPTSPNKNTTNNNHTNNNSSRTLHSIGGGGERSIKESMKETLSHSLSQGLSKSGSRVVPSNNVMGDSIRSLQSDGGPSDGPPITTSSGRASVDALSVHGNFDDMGRKNSDMGRKNSMFAFYSKHPITQSKFEALMLATDRETGTGSNQNWWDINFKSQEMEDMFRKLLGLQNLWTIRFFILIGTLVAFIYQRMIENVTTHINWSLRILLFCYCALLLPITSKDFYLQYQAFVDYMMSFVLAFFGFVFIIISFLDKFDGAPTESYLLMGSVMMLNIIITFVTSTIWFRKMAINVLTIACYICVAVISQRICYGHDDYFVEKSQFTAKLNKYPVIEIMLDYDQFKFHNSCSPLTELFATFKQIMFAFGVSVISTLCGYITEQKERREFSKKWNLIKNKVSMEKKLKSFEDKVLKSTTKKETIFGEIRSLTFESPMMKVLALIEKVRLAVPEEIQVLEAMSTIEDTLKNTDDLNKVDIQTQDFAAGDMEFAKFVQAAGGRGAWQRDRHKSVPQLFDTSMSIIPNVDADAEDSMDGLNAVSLSASSALITEIGLPDGSRLLTKEILPLLEYLLEFEEWGFDVHKLKFMSNGRPMYFLFLKHMERFYDQVPYDFDIVSMKAFILYVEETYSFDPSKPNAYHTHLHGADVLQTVGCIIKHEFIQNKLGSLDKLTTLVASTMHDYRHKGVNNAFLVNSNDTLALIHNDSSVLERFHASEMFLLLKSKKYDMNFLKNLSPDDYKYFRSSAIEMILATDLSVGYKYITKFQHAVRRGTDDWGDTPDDTLLLMQMCLKVADVSHPSKALGQHKVWSVMITNEFFDQGDLEKAKGMVVGPLCDRLVNYDIPKSQLGFIDFVVSPTMKPVAETLNMQVVLDNLKNNYRYWSELHQVHDANDTLRQSFDILCKEVEEENAIGSSSQKANWSEINSNNSGSGSRNVSGRRSRNGSEFGAEAGSGGKGGEGVVSVSTRSKRLPGDV